MKSSDLNRRYGPWALIAGASEGLGAAFARQLAAQGFHLVLVARRQALLDELAEQLGQEYATEIRTVALDLAREDAAAVLSENTAEIEVGLLVYNAAYSKIGPFLETSLEEHQQEIAVNCRTPATLTYLFGKKMVERGRGGIVLMSSMSAMQGSPLVANYGATKAFNQILAEGLWDEWRTLGVDVLSSCPAPVNTPGYQASAPRGAVSALAPDKVVSDALQALGRGPVTVPGLRWRAAGFLMQRVLPRAGAIKMIGSATRKMYGKK